MAQEQVDTLIIGAGVSGLATAAALGLDHNLKVLERDGEIGGYCKTVKKDGFVWDYSGHFFHFKHPEIETWLRERMGAQRVLKVNKRSFVSYGGRQIDFPFQKNIHQLPQAEFIECLHDLYFARTGAAKPEGNFKQMLHARFGQAICEKFLIPYNEKLYATDLSNLDKDAMGRFFPHADLNDIVRNMKVSDNQSYNSSFTYPEGGAIEYVKALASAVDPARIRLGEALTSIDLAHKIARTERSEYRFERLVSSAPFNQLASLSGLEHDAAAFSWNQVLVFNLGFDAKGPREVHWVYYPDRARAFYRVGFYDNIFDADRMSLYVEVGLKAGEKPDVAAIRQRVLDGLKAEGVVTSQKLVAEHSVLMNPAYVHINQRSNAERDRLNAIFLKHQVHSIGRYGGWTYCSIEDNIVEARALVQGWG